MGYPIVRCVPESTAPPADGLALQAAMAAVMVPSGEVPR